MSLGEVQPDVANQADACPVCGHTTAESAKYPNDGIPLWMRRLLHMRPPVESCLVPVEDVSGWSPPPCGCDHEYHA